MPHQKLIEQSQDELGLMRLARDAALTAAREAVRDATRLTRLLSILNNSDDHCVMLDRALATLSELFAADVVILLDPSSLGSFAPLVSLGLPEDMVEVPLPVQSGDSVDQVMGGSDPLQNKCDDSSALGALFADLGLSHTVYIPVISGQTRRGVLILARIEDRCFSSSEIGLLRSMANHLGVTIEQNQRRYQLENIVQSSRTFDLIEQDVQIIQRMAEMLPKQFGADGAFVVLLDKSGGIRRQVGYGRGLPDEADLTKLVTKLLSFTDLDAFEPFNLDQSRQCFAGPWDLAECANMGRLGGLLVAPIGGHRLQGLLMVFRQLRVPFSTDMQPILMLHADRAASLLENSRLYHTVNEELQDRKRAEQALQKSEARLAALIRSVEDLVIVLDASDHVRFTNPAGRSLWPQSELNGDPVSFWSRVVAKDRSRLEASLVDLKGEAGATRTEAITLVHQDGTLHDYDMVATNLLKDSALSGIVITMHDVTMSRHYARELETLAFRDPLTGLSNRAHFMDSLKKRMASHEGDCVGQMATVLYFDLDHFKTVNDSLGHEAGDKVLTSVANRIKHRIEGPFLAGRMGGDEFTLLLEAGADLAMARSVANSLLKEVQKPIMIANRSVQVGVSIGIAQGCIGHDNAEDLLHRADVAMYRSKNLGRNIYTVYDDRFEAHSAKLGDAEADLSRGIVNHEITVIFQPVVLLESRRIVAAEALARWKHPERGLIEPEEFIPLAEQTGQISALSMQVIDIALRQSSLWRARYGNAIPIALNLSPKQICQTDFAERLIAALHRHSVKASDITLEITEGSLIEDAEQTALTLRQLREEGFRIAIDDFGTGYCSLAYLRDFSLDVLKIDRSFIKTIQHREQDRKIVGSIIELARALDMTLVVEGVEKEEQAAILANLGCDHAQGYLFAPALPIPEFEALCDRLLAGRSNTTDRSVACKGAM